MNAGSLSWLGPLRLWGWRGRGDFSPIRTVTLSETRTVTLIVTLSPNPNLCSNLTQELIGLVVRLAEITNVRVGDLKAKKQHAASPVRTSPPGKLLTLTLWMSP